MIIHPIAKINLGLNVVERRPDSYHNLETVFYPVGITDALEVSVMDSTFPSPFDCDLKITPAPLPSDEQQNLVVRAYRLLKQEFPQLPRLHAHLWKGIPSQAGMGGGSSDGAAMLLLLNHHFSLGLTTPQLISRAASLGADCPFFIVGQPAYAEGIGEQLQPVALDLSSYWLCIVRPDIPVSTREAFSLIRPHRPATNCRDIIQQPVDTWRDELVNDFEQSVFAIHPRLAAIKERLYSLGAVYAAMSGSGSSLFGLFRHSVDAAAHFTAPGTFTACLKL